MKSYGEYCALARALDVVGDRWSLLIVRELMARPCRYTDLRDGLPGIATNLLAGRLRQLIEASIVTAVEEPPPIATTVYRLTERGQALRGALYELVRWGAPLMIEPQGDQEFRSRWMGLGVEGFFAGRAGSVEATIQLNAGEEPWIVRIGNGQVHSAPGTAEEPDLTITGSPQLVLGLLVGYVSPADLPGTGAELTGDPSILTRLHAEAA
jgi:DNA-binding HxlR family transcriptional regulator